MASQERATTEPHRHRVGVCLGALALLTACAATPPAWLPPSGAPAGALTLAQVMIRVTRDTVLNSQPLSGVLLASGINQSEIRDGSIAAGRVICCGGPTEADTAMVFYVPEALPTEVGDIVEVKLGRVPEKAGDVGTVNRATRVVQKGTGSGGACRWEPPNPRLWGRVLYCDWMPSEGWVQEGPSPVTYHTWIRKQP